MESKERSRRWRLILGDAADSFLGKPDGSDARSDRALEFLYGREYEGRNVWQGSGDERHLTIPDWINEVHTLFPKQTIERIERDALERYKLDELVTVPDLLERAQPNIHLLKAVMRTKHLMNQEVLKVARSVVSRVIEELMNQIASEIKPAFSGTVDRRRPSLHKVAKNFDARTTIRRSLAHFDRKSQRIFIKRPYFNSRVRIHSERWHIIILVDQSGSMLENVIHAAVMASIFHGLKAIRTHLCAFDTEVVDMSDEVADPLETLMKVQLGGGTDINRAVTYATSLIQNPRKTMVILVSDLFEGGDPEQMMRTCRGIIEGGSLLIALLALDKAAEPYYCDRTAQRLADLGAKVGAMTPGELAVWIAEIIR